MTTGTQKNGILKFYLEEDEMGKVIRLENYDESSLKKKSKMALRRVKIERQRMCIASVFDVRDFRPLSHDGQ